MVKRIVIAFATALGLVAATAVAPGPADAQVYPPPVAGCTVSDTSVSPGQTISITCSGYLGSVTVTFTFFSQPVSLGAATTDAGGTVNADLTIPANAAAGSHTITAEGASASGTLTNSVALTVVGDGAAGAGAGARGGTGDLPRTGDDTSLPLARIAAVLVAAGGIALFLARRRQADADRPTAGVGS